ncbi:MAG: acyclic terpene utilization AtuA family protein, partial [Woeseiaceae bacterium]
MKSIRIGSGAGYAGDRVEPAVALIEHGDLDYIIFECLAERTIAIAQQEKLRDPEAGYNGLLPYRMERVIPAIKNRRVRIVSNMGAANPIGAARKILEIARKHGLSKLKIAAITGDDVVDRLGKFVHLETLETHTTLSTLRDKVISANAYTGAQKITEALEAGADIVITGRTADPALALGPIMHEFGHSFDDCDFIGKGIAAGHLLECGSQVMGGYFADPGYKIVPELWNVGFPIIEMSRDGAITIQKLPSAGGLVSEATVKEQLLYEIHDPHEYLTPDGIADFSKIAVTQTGDNKVLVENATGRERTHLLKVSVGYQDGYIGEGEISYGGSGASLRAQLAADIVRRRFELIGLNLQELRLDLIGVNSLFGETLRQKLEPDRRDEEYRDVRLRVAGRVATEDDAKTIGREVEALYTNGPAGGGGARAYVRQILSIASV